MDAKTDFVIVDVEATCCEHGTKVSNQEIIEIGTVLLDQESLQVVDEFSAFVRPTFEPILSDFCTNLTSIRQSDVDRAEDFPTVLGQFLAWVGQGPFVWCSWGEYDLKQIRSECQRRGIVFPGCLERHLNLKRLFAELRSIRPCGMSEALRILGMPLQGTHHRAIDDARNIANIARVVLPAWAPDAGSDVAAT